jgi:subtilisin family serine protease
MSQSNFQPVTEAWLEVQNLLTAFANDPQSQDILLAAFGDTFNREAATSFLKTEIGNNFSNLPNFEIRNSAEINHANGAYSSTTNTIYLAAELLERNDNDFNNNNDQIIESVILEEIGHFLDQRFNSADAPGDEGNLFAAFVQRDNQKDNLSDADIAQIKSEDDTATVILDEQTIKLEQANPGENPAFDLIGLTDLRNDPQFAGIDGSGLSVAVIDTGIDTAHPLLKNNYITGYDFFDDDSDPSDEDGHGTHVLGTVGATDETIGVAPDVDLIGLKVSGADDDNEGSIPLSDATNALQWVLDNHLEYNITAVNMSFGSGFYNSESEVTDDPRIDLINSLEQAGVTIVSSAGNNYYVAQQEQLGQSSLTAPAIYSTIAVGAVWQDSSEPSPYLWESGAEDLSVGADRLVSFSQRSDADNFLLAPGAVINSTAVGGDLKKVGGTSQATPHVTGAVALLQEASLQFGGRLLTPDEVVDILRSSADGVIDGDDEDDNVTNTEISYPRINIYNAIVQVKQQFSLNNEDDDLTPGSTVYRFFRPDVGVHFYTASETERDSLIANLPQYTYEGASYNAAPENADPVTGAKPVYRFFNKNAGVHLYTISEEERDSIQDNLSNYNFEGIAYYGYESDLEGTSPLYRFYNPVVDAHFYTPSAAERDSILKNLPDYQLESNDGVAFYIEPLAEI